MAPEQIEALRRDVEADPGNLCLSTLAIRAEIQAGLRPTKDPHRSPIVLVRTLRGVPHRSPSPMTEARRPVHIFARASMSTKNYATACSQVYLGGVIVEIDRASAVTCASCRLAVFGRVTSLYPRQEIQEEQL